VTSERGLVLAIGEVLWDLLPDGPQLGGAPLNVAVHLVRLGRPAAMFTGIGADEPGSRARREIEAAGVDVAWIQTSAGRPTGSARVRLDGPSPAFDIIRPAAYDDVRLDSQTLLEIVRAAPSAIAIGTLAQEARQVRAATIVVQDACPTAVRFYDANLRDGWDGELVDELLRSATVIKLNETEAREVARLRGLPAEDPPAFLDDLAAQTGARSVCVTRGADGAALLLDGVFVEGRPAVIEPVDTVGAGDAFAAALLDGILAGRDAAAILRRALALGALVAGRRGATPAWETDELEAMIGGTPIPA
jgi:fructokinase